MDWIDMKATLNKSLAERKASLGAVCGVENPRHSGAMAVACFEIKALHPIPNRGLALSRGLIQRCLEPRWPVLWMAVLLACCVAPLLRPAQAMSQQQGMKGEFPSTWDGRVLRPLALSAVEQRFAAQFPGRLVRLTDGEQSLVWREVRSPTRLLHPAADCYRGLGYRIETTHLENDAQARLWRCFVAVRNTPSGPERVRVCERIVDAKGQAFTDTSSWFWAAQLGQSTGPWLAITTARAL